MLANRQYGAVLITVFSIWISFGSGTAQAARTIDMATVNGGLSTTVEPGQTLSVSLSVTGTYDCDGCWSTNDWESTGWYIGTTPPGPVSCENHQDHTGPWDSYTETFDITAPNVEGSYNAYLIAYSNDNCSSGASTIYTLTNAVVVELPPPPLPVAWYSMDQAGWAGNTGEVVDETGSYDGTAVNGADTDGTTPAIPGEPGTCRYGVFDGNNDYVQVPGLSNVLNGTASLAFWIKTTQRGDDTAWRAPGITGVEEAGGTDDIFWGWLDDDGHIGITVGNDNSAKSDTAIRDGDWHHVVLTRDAGNGAYKIYIDGSLDESGTIAPGIIGNSYSSIGRIEDTGGSPEYFDGELDEVQIFDKVLSTGEVQQVYQQTHSCYCSSRIGQGTINELYRSGNTRFAEVKVLDNTLPQSVWEDWYVVACAGEGGQRVCTGSPTTTRIADIPAGSDRNYPWFVWDETIFTNHKVFRFNNGGMDVALFDASGRYMDYLSVSGYTYQEPNPSCSFLYPTTATGTNQAGDIYRLPDGTGPWEFVQNGPPTRAALNAAPSGQLGSLVISPLSTSASTCAPEPVTITAYDKQGNVYTDYTGTVSITTSSGHGNWSINNGVGGTTPDPDSDDDGAVTYFFEFSGADQGTVTLNLANSHADDLTITATDVADPTITVTSGTYSFRDNAIVITDVDSLPGTEVVAGRDHALRATVWRRDSSDCSVAAEYSGTVPLKIWYSADTGHPAGAAAPAVGAATLPTAPPGVSNVSLDFTSGEADFNLSTSDIGHFVLNVLDDQSGFAVDVNGLPRPIGGDSSGAFIVRPFGYEVTVPGNPGALDHTGARFIRAGRNLGDSFAADVRAVVWQGTDDANDDGIPDNFADTDPANNADLSDNAITPSFGNETSGGATIALSAVAVHPDTAAGGIAGTLTGAPAGLAASDGTATTGNVLRYSEVGVIQLNATSGSYFGAAMTIEGGSGAVGRFYPNHFEVVGVPTLTHRSGLGCAPASTFSYQNEPFTVGFTLEARNADGDRTRNYETAGSYDYAYLNIATALAGGELNFGAVDDPDGTPSPLTGRLDQQSVGGTFSDGQAVVTASMALARDATPDGPFQDLRLGINPVDSDGVALASSDLDPALSGTDTHRQVATGDVRYGRLALQNAHGSELMALGVPLRAEYYDGNAFVTNVDDYCTNLAVGQLNLSSEVEANQVDGDVQIQPNVTTQATLSNAPLLAGDAGLSFCPPGNPTCTPGSGNVGYVDIIADAPSYLEFNWDGTGDQDPQGRATFGIYGGSENVIYLREEY